MKHTEKIAMLYGRGKDLGFAYAETTYLLQIERTLQRVSIAMCNGDMYRDEETGRMLDRNKRPVRDLERSALKRLDRFAKDFPGLVFYYQRDPRGCALYVIKKKVLGADDINAVYNRGLAMGL